MHASLPMQLMPGTALIIFRSHKSANIEQDTPRSKFIRINMDLRRFVAGIGIIFASAESEHYSAVTFALHSLC